MRSGRVLSCGVLVVLSSLTLSGCDGFLANQTGSLGGATAGGRGVLRVLFINNTPDRAVFTYGSYDQSDQLSQPDFEQFGPTRFDMNLDGESQSDIRSIECARIFAIGSPPLFDLIERNLPEAPVVDQALIEGVEFFRVDSGADEADGEDTLTSDGTAPPFEALLGVDFPCNSLLIVRFEVDDLGPTSFRTDFELIPSESTR